MLAVCGLLQDTTGQCWGVLAWAGNMLPSDCSTRHHNTSDTDVCVCWLFWLLGSSSLQHGWQVSILGSHLCDM